jgi:hypothetical protein
MMKLWLDKETFSEVDLTKVGAYKYAEHESTEILLTPYALDDGEPEVWDVTTGDEPPTELTDALQDDSVTVFAHNANFDRTILRLNRLGLPVPALSRWRCTMAQALSHALPGGLSDLCTVLGVPEDEAKLKEGEDLLNMFSKPQPKNRKLRRLTRETNPVAWQQLVAYGKRDIIAMRACYRRMPRWNWNASAIAEWHCDQRINDRGFQVDTELTRAGAVAAVLEKQRITSEFNELTGINPSQREKFKAWLNAHGVPVEDTTKDTFNQFLKNPTWVSENQLAATLMALALQSNKTSTAKYAALDVAVGHGDRFRGGLQFAGAGRTRRWAGRLFQAQNLPSRGLPKAVLVEQYIDCLKHGTHELFFENLMLFGAAALRGCVIVPPGTKLVAADLSNIEGRKLAWFANENWKLQAFRDYDAGAGPDLYNITATSIIGGDPWKVAKVDRNVFGKVPDLACFSATTEVLTDHGLKHIVDVTVDDRVWDGVQWTKHAGVIAKGVRSVVVVDGIEVTPDHLMNVSGFWRPAQDLATCADTLSRALATGLANLPSPGSCGVLAAVSEPSKPVAPAAQTTELPKLTFGAAHLLGALRALKRKLSIRRNGTSVTKRSVPTKSIAGACSTESLRASIAVATRMMLPTRTMVVVASACSHLGSRIVGSFFNTSLRCLDGIGQNLSWTGATLTSVTNPATCVLSPSVKTATISERFKTYNSGSTNSKPVYDIALAGARTRFLVKSDSGWLMAHNCGYRGGVAGFQTFAKGYGVRMADHWVTIQKLIDKEHVDRAIWGLKTWGRPQLDELEISETEWLASETCKLAWRGRHPMTVKLWGWIEEAAKRAIQNWGTVQKINNKLSVGCVTHHGQRWMCVRLPSGRFLTYFNPTLRTERSGDRVNQTIYYEGEASEAGKTTRQWRDISTHGGKMTGNICQTSARDILAQALPEAEEAGYLPVLTVHDEGVTECPDTPNYNVEGLCAFLAKDRDWTVGLPLSAAGFEGYRYKKED